MKALKIETILDTETGCWNCISHKPIQDGYHPIRIKGKSTYVHRVVYERYNGKIPEGLGIIHSCDNPHCCNPAHMRVGTQAENIADKVNKNRQSKGVGHGAAKLTEKQVLSIRRERKHSTLQELAEKYKVCISSISGISNRVSWRHI